MKAADIMTTSIITIGTNARVSDVAEKLFAHGISALPVVGEDGGLVGIVSEGDLVRIAEAEIEPGRRSWWLRLLAGKETLATELTKAKAWARHDQGKQGRYRARLARRERPSLCRSALRLSPKCCTSRSG
jgi:CBS-domain-containing membrane protein